MSRRSMFKDTSTSDETFTLAAWDAARDAEKTMGAKVTITLAPSERRGVWNVLSVLRLEEVDQEIRTLITTFSSYPNARAAALSSFLFSETNKLALMADQKYRSEEELKEPGRQP